MKILNIMLGKGKGGLEQAALDYSNALIMSGHEVTTITRTDAWAQGELAAKDLPMLSLSAKGEWDVFAVRALKQMGNKAQAECVIAHGNRAIGLALKAFKGTIAVVGVAHNYNIEKRFPKCDAVFSITRDIIEELVHLNVPRARLFHIPNMIHLPQHFKRDSFQTPPIIATMGRFVPKKGFEIFIEALRIVVSQGHEFHAIIGGDGELDTALKALTVRAGLEDHITFSGWVEDTSKFLHSADIFVLPSHHEPFGIVLIEAMAHGLPCITTDTEGPCEIITQHKDAIMVPKASPSAMAHAIIDLLERQEEARKLGEAAYQKVKSRYEISVVAAQLDKAVTRVKDLANQAS